MSRDLQKFNCSITHSETPQTNFDSKINEVLEQIKKTLVKTSTLTNPPSWSEIEKSAGTDFVPMNSQKEMILIDNHKLATFGLQGCNAIALIANDGKNNIGYISHYDSFHKDILQVQFEKELHELNEKGYNLLGVVIMSPGEYVKKGEKWTMEFCDINICDKILDIMNKYSGYTESTLIKYPYDLKRFEGLYGQGTLGVHISNGVPQFEIEGIVKKL